MMPESTAGSSGLASFLRGIRVLDLSALLPGPFASLLLADMGAEVLKVEPPQGDAMAHIGPRVDTGAGAETAVFYEAVNAGKAVCRMDLKDPACRDELLRMLSAFDVMIEGARPGVMQRLGLDYGSLSATYPRLVYCSISGHGQSGPCALEAGHDVNYLAVSGILHRNAGGSPSPIDPPMCDLSGSLFAVISILGALRHRDVTGKGTHLDLGLADAAMPLQMLQVAAYAARGDIPVSRGTELNGGSAYYNVYLTADGRHVALGAMELKFWEKFCIRAGHPEWIAQRFKPSQTLLIDTITQFFSSLTLAHCVAQFDDPECCVSPVLDLQEALSTLHLKTRGLVTAGASGGLQTLFPLYVNGKPPAPRTRLIHVSPHDYLKTQEPAS